jgi:WD40 repeat protein
MQHTYLRYECGDAFGLIASSASSKAPQSNSIFAFASPSRERPILLTTAGSYCMGYHLRTTEPTIKIGHREQLSGGVGTGRALNSDQLVCMDVAIDKNVERLSSSSSSSGSCKVATGWVDGAVRVFDVQADELNARSGCGLVQSLVHENGRSQFGGDDFVMREPLVLNGHSGSPIRSIAYDKHNDGTRLASGSSDGSVVLWDVVEETGLFRLLGHRGGITDIHFVQLADGELDLLVTTSLDAFVKVWDLKGQCCIQTIPSHRGELWAADCIRIPGLAPALRLDPMVDKAPIEEERIRLVTGSADGQARVWSVSPPKRYSVALAPSKLPSDGSSVVVDNPGSVEDNDDKDENLDDVCHYIGTLTAPPNVSTSAERISCIHFHPNGKFVGILHANSKNVDVYLIRSVQESLRKKQRRLRRRKEKATNKATTSTTADDRKGGGNEKGPKRGLLDDPESDDDNNDIEPNIDVANELEKSLDPDTVKASDEFEYFGTVRAGHKVKGFIFVPYKEPGGGLRIVCSLATNALETHSLTRKKGR